MKKLIYISILFLVSLVSCDSDPDLPMPDMIRFHDTNAGMPNIVADENGEQFFDFFALPTTNVDLVFNHGIEGVVSADLMVMKGDDFSTVHKITNVTTFPHTENLNIQDIVDLFDEYNVIADVEAGASFKFFMNLVMTDGQVQNGRDAYGIKYSPDLMTAPGASIEKKIAVLCPYDVSMSTGSYRAVSSDWGMDADVTITADPADPFTLYITGLATADGANEDAGPLEMHVDPATYTVSVTETILATSAFGYTDFKYAGSGSLNTCTGQFDMLFNISVSIGGWGDNAFTLTRND